MLKSFIIQAIQQEFQGNKMFSLILILFITVAHSVEITDKIIPGYGIEFQKLKNISPGTSVLDLVIQIPLPQLTFTSASAQIFEAIKTNCENSSNKELSEICEQAMIRYQGYKVHEYVVSKQMHDKMTVLSSLLPHAQLVLPVLTKPNWVRASAPGQDFRSRQVQYLGQIVNKANQGEQPPRRSTEGPTPSSAPTAQTTQVSETVASYMDLYTESNLTLISTRSDPRLRKWNKIIGPWKYGNVTTKYTVDDLRQESMRADEISMLYGALNIQEQRALQVRRVDVVRASNGTLRDIMQQREANIRGLEVVFLHAHEILRRGVSIEPQITGFNMYVNFIKQESQRYIRTYSKFEAEILLQKIQAYKKESDQPASRALDALTAKLRTNAAYVDNEQPPQTREKRSIALFSSIYSIVRVEQLAKAVNALNKLSSANADEILKIRGELIVITRHLQEGMRKTARQLEHFQETMTQVMDNFAILANRSNILSDRVDKIARRMYYFILFSDVFDPMLDREQWIQQVQHQQVNEFVRAIETLTEGRLPTFLVKPEKLDQLISQAMKTIAHSHENYELLFPEVKENYQQPFIRFTHDRKGLYIQIPIFLKNKNQKDMTLFKIKTVPVPFVGNKDSANASEWQYYTKIKQVKKYIAVNKLNHEEMTSEEVRQCLETHDRFICVKTSAEYDYTAQTCASALFYEDFTRHEIQNLCKFVVVTPEQVQTEVLENKDTIVLANARTPWKLICNPNLDIPSVIRHQQYVVLRRKDLCGCRIDANTFILRERLDACTENNNTVPKFRFTVNEALISQWPGLINVTDRITSLFKSPPQLKLPHVQVKQLSFPNVLENTEWDEYEVSLSSFVDKLRKRKQVWSDKSSKLKADLITIKALPWDKILHFFSWFGKYWKLFTAAVIIMIILIAICCMTVHCNIRQELTNLSGKGPLIIRSKLRNASLIRRVRRTAHNGLHGSENQGFHELQEIQHV